MILRETMLGLAMVCFCLLLIGGCGEAPPGTPVGNCDITQKNLIPPCYKSITGNYNGQTVESFRCDKGGDPCVLTGDTTKRSCQNKREAFTNFCYCVCGPTL